MVDLQTFPEILEAQVTETEVKTRDQRVSALAYKIWEEEGRPEGRSEAHWMLACERIDALDAAQKPITLWLSRQESSRMETNADAVTPIQRAKSAA